jgi:2-oxoglutarate dehydrogenase E2 component (dihydrolipoamide succinyltransferase)
MAVQVKVPTVGESITEVTIGSWHRKDGDTVQMDEVIADLESDKAAFELRAPEAGVLKIVKQEGETVPVGELICEIDPSGAAAKSSGESPKKEAPKKEEKAEAKAEEPKPSADGAKKSGKVREMRVPAVGESITEVTLSTWLKKDGDRVALDEIIAEVESDKATFELPAEAAGILHIVAKEKETIPVGGLICTIDEVADSAPAKAEAAPAAESSATSEAHTYAAGHPSPAAAKILEERGIKADDVKGTGRDGRITKEDAMQAQPAPKPAEKEKAPAPQPAAAPAPVGSRNVRREKMSSLRKTIARRLVSVRNETAMLTTFNEVDMKAIMDLRKQYKDKFKEKYGIGLGFMSFFTKAVCVALKEWPAVNAQIDGDDIVYHDYCDISIAVSTPRGLVVPVVRNADLLTFDQIESEIARLAVKAREGKLSIDEMQGGTFSITNGGVFGSMLSTPILNPPQSAILGMHNIVERPVAKNGEIVIRPVMFVALSYDHRIIDGRESVSFLYRVKELLEDPGRLILGV